MGFKTGLDISGMSGDFINVIEARHEAGSAVIRQFGAASGLRSFLSPSLTAANILDEEAFKKAIKKLCEDSSISSKSIAVAIPDECVKISFLEFEDIPKERYGVIDLILWHHKKTLPFPAGETVVDYQVITAPDKENHVYRLIAVAAMAAVINQYEDLFNDCGLRPDKIMPASLAVYNLYQEKLDNIVSGAILMASDNIAAMIAAENSRPRFFRSRPVEGLPECFRELFASFNYYQKTHSALPETVYILDMNSGESNMLAEMQSRLNFKDIKFIGLRDCIKGCDSGMDKYSAAVGAAI